MLPWNLQENNDACLEVNFHNMDKNISVYICLSSNWFWNWERKKRKKKTVSAVKPSNSLALLESDINLLKNLDHFIYAFDVLRKSLLLQRRHRASVVSFDQGILIT